MRYILFFSLMIIHFHLIFAQTDSKLSSIEITEDQTTHLIFPSNITYVDLGNSEYFITDYTDNILRIKGRQHQPTNLTVITQDQFYYSFLVKYTSQPQLNYFIETHQSLKNLASNQEPVSNRTKNHFKNNSKSSYQANYQATMVKLDTPISKHQPTTNNSKTDPNHIEQTAQDILDNKPIHLFITDRHGDVKLKVTGVYHSLDHCYIKYEIQNSGAIPYDVHYTEFGIRDKQRPKRTAINETVLNPLLILNGDRKRVLPYRINRYVAVFEKLAVPKNRICYMEVIEAGRNLHLNIPFQRIKIEAVRE